MRPAVRASTQRRRLRLGVVLVLVRGRSGRSSVIRCRRAPARPGSDLRALARCRKPVVGEPVDRHRAPSARPGDPDADLERDLADVIYLRRSQPAPTSPARTASRSTTRRPRRAAPRGSSCRSVLVDARRPVTSSWAERAARRRDDLPLAVIRPPIHSTSALRTVAIYAITSTRRSAGDSRPSWSSTSRSARIETSSWSSVGSRVVSRCSQRPGASSVISTRLSACLPAKRISS